MVYVRVRHRAAAVGRSARRCRRGCCCRWLALPLAVPVVADRAHAHRRPVAQRRAGAAPGMLQLAFCVLLSAGLLLELMAGSRVSAGRGCALRAPLRAAWGELARARAAARAARRSATATSGDGEAAPLEPYDGVSLDDGARGARRLRARCCATPTRDAARRAARRLRGRARPARRRSPRSTSRCGTARAGAPARRSRSCSTPRAARAVAGQRDDRRRGPRRRAAAAAAAAARGRLPLREGQGRRSATTRAGSPRCAPRSGRDVAIRVDANGAWATPSEALANLRALAPAGLELCEEPVHGVEALRAVRARVAGADRDGRDGGRAGRAGVGRRRRGVPEDRPLRRHHRRAARRRARRARPGARSTSPRRSTARSGSPPACTPPRRCGPAAAAAGWRRSARSTGTPDVLAPQGGEIAVPERPGLLG